MTKHIYSFGPHKGKKCVHTHTPTYVICLWQEASLLQSSGSQAYVTAFFTLGKSMIPKTKESQLKHVMCWKEQEVLEFRRLALKMTKWSLLILLHL